MSRISIRVYVEAKDCCMVGYRMHDWPRDYRFTSRIKGDIIPGDEVVFGYPGLLASPLPEQPS